MLARSLFRYFTVYLGFYSPFSCRVSIVCLVTASALSVSRSFQPGQIRIFQCKWINCDSQFDSENGLYEHIVQHHTSQIISTLARTLAIFDAV